MLFLAVVLLRVALRMTELTSLDTASLIGREERSQGENRSPELQQEGNCSSNQDTKDGESDEENQEGSIEGAGEQKVEGEEEEEVGECGFCLFMKSGPCRESFIKWEECVEQAEKAKEDIVEKCHQVTFLLKECMERNSDYYEPVLQAEKAMGEAALEEADALQGNANPDPQMPAESENHRSAEHQEAPVKEQHPPE